jgi:RNA 2',3'-cyclic 3'-phosphodiesterase
MGKSMKKLRLFICVNLDDTLRADIYNSLSKVISDYPSLKWVKPKNLHITLKFLGDVPVDKIENIRKILTYIANNYKEFSIELSKIGVFPDFRRPKIIWLGIFKGSEELEKIAYSLEEELEKTGFPKENKSFSSHITLARVKYIEKNINNILQDISIGNWEQKVKKIELMQSSLYSTGPIYESLAEFPLGTINL